MPPPPARCAMLIWLILKRRMWALVRAGQACLAQVLPVACRVLWWSQRYRWHLTPTGYAIVVRRALPAIETLVRKAEKSIVMHGLFVGEDGRGRNVMVHEIVDTDFGDEYLRKSGVL
jgi:hypothetical protein